MAVGKETDCQSPKIIKKFIAFLNMFLSFQLKLRDVGYSPTK